jgi:PKD repeat protein
MKSKSLILVMAGVLLLCLCVSDVSAVNGVHNINRATDFATIQAAIDDSATVAGDTILVDGGDYSPFIVNKQLTIRGSIDSGNAVTYVKISGSGNAISVSADGVILDNFVLQQLSPTTQGKGVYVTSSSNVLRNIKASGFIRGMDFNAVNNNGVRICYLEDNDYGIFSAGSGNTISQCTFTASAPDSEGISLTGTGNTVKDSYFYNFGIAGISLGNGLSDNNNIIHGNYFENLPMFSTAIALNGPSNTIDSNTFLNDDSSIRMLGFANNNIIYNNFFKNSPVNVAAQSNYWDNGKISGLNVIGGSYLGGNYWESDPPQDFSVSCSDTTPVDGICDNAYTIGGLNVDNYPLTGTSGTPTITSVTPHTAVSNGPDLEVDIYGTNFVSGSQVGISINEGPWLEVINTDVVDSTHIKCTLVLTGATPSFYTVSVSNPTNYESSHEDPIFTVTESLLTPAITSDVQSGPAPLTVEFNDVSTGGATGRAWYFGDETYSGTWTQMKPNDLNGWLKQYGQSSVVLPDGSIVLIGVMTNDVWRSTDKGATWTLMTSAAEYGTGRWEASVVAMPDGSIVLMGGSHNTDYYNDVWRSVNNGASWDPIKPNDGNYWTARHGQTSVALSDGSIVLMGGNSGVTYYNDVWRSTDNGATWNQQTATAGWQARTEFGSVVMPDNSIVIMGGYVSLSVWQHDVWRSTDNGATWNQQTATAGWQARSGFGSVVMPDGSMVLIGGWNGVNALNDMWRSTDTGATWTQVTPTGLPARDSASSVVTPDGSIVLMGGSSCNTPQSCDYNDVHLLTTATSLIKNPSHTYTVPGIYSLALQAYNANGYTSGIWKPYITVTGPTVSPTVSGVVPSTGPTTGGTIVTITGSGFTGVTNVLFGTASTIAPSYIDDSTIIVPTPPYTAGVVDVAVITPGGTGTKTNAFTYQAAGGGTITVTSPNGGEPGWDIGTTHSITWTAANVVGTTVDISAVKDGITTTPITYGAELASGSYSWTIPQDWVTGNYVIQVTSSSDPGISDVSDGPFTIAQPPVTPVVADFTENKLNEVAPLNVQFTDRSTGLPTAWSWDFGDGSKSSVKDPYHTYYGAGQSYTVSLKVTKGVDSSTKTMFITVPAANAPAADFTFDASNGNAVQFTDKSTGGAHTVLWDFGDGSSIADPNPVHTFDLGADKTRTFWVKLTATYSGVPYSVTKQVAVATITKVSAAAQVPPPTKFTEFNHISPVPIPAGTLVFGGGQPSIPVPKPGFLVARYPYHRNGDGATQLYLVTSEGEYQDLGVAQSLPLGAVVEAEDPYGMTVAPYGGANGVVSAETSQTAGGLGSLSLLSKVTPGSQTHNYAVLIDGGKSASDNHIRYWNDISFMYQTLTKVYGYPKANIIVLMANKGTTADRHYKTESGTVYTDNSPLDLDGDGSPETVYAASYSNLISQLYNLNASKTSSDHLFIFTTGHGGPKSGGTSDDVIYYLWNQETITDIDFVNALPDKFGDITLVMEQCNSGGFVDNFNSNFHSGYTTQKRIIHTAASKTESSYGNAFSNVWTRGVAMVNDRVQPTTEADTSGSDGKVSMDEAFKFAQATDPAATGALSPNIETPQYKNINTPGETGKFLATDGWATPNMITVTAPNIVETWYAGFDHPILWTSRGVTNAKIELYNSTSGAYYQLTGTTTAATGKWTWLGTDNTNRYAAAATGKYKIRISDYSASGTNDLSDQYFTIQRNGVAGGLSVTSNIAGAKIYLDGVDTGYTTIVGDKSISSTAAPGTHTIALVAPTGYLDQVKMVTRTSGASNFPVTFNLLSIDTNANYRDDDAGSMTITATPPDSHIYIDGEDKGTTLFKQEVVPGVNWEAYPHTYTVRVERPGYNTVTKEIKVGRGWNVNENFELTPTFSVGAITLSRSTPIPLTPPTSITVSAPITYTGSGTHTATWDWDDGTTSPASVSESGGSGTITGTHTYTTTGVNTVTLTVTDTNSGVVQISTYQYAVVYDPNAGYVVGAGTIDSPVGAYKYDSSSGTALFGFVSKYVKGKTVPQGITEFYYHAGDMNFVSTNYDWLVINSPRATYKGTGQINGQGNYKFTLTAIDGALQGRGKPDKFRIRITDTTEKVRVYDNMLDVDGDTEPTTVVKCGFIILQK